MSEERVNLKSDRSERNDDRGKSERGWLIEEPDLDRIIVLEKHAPGDAEETKGEGDDRTDEYKRVQSHPCPP